VYGTTGAAEEYGASVVGSAGLAVVTADGAGIGAGCDAGFGGGTGVHGAIGPTGENGA
jgi:hypothetical protein